MDGVLLGAESYKFNRFKGGKLSKTLYISDNKVYFSLLSIQHSVYICTLRKSTTLCK